jgi:DNA-binding transcriptional regulator PaaX
MNFDDAKVDDAVLALLFLTMGNDDRAWKDMDFDALQRLYKAGMIDNPVRKTRSVQLTEEGAARSRQLAEKMFAKK